MHLAADAVRQLCLRAAQVPRLLRQRSHRRLGRLPQLHEALRRARQGGVLEDQ